MRQDTAISLERAFNFLKEQSQVKAALALGRQARGTRHAVVHGSDIDRALVLGRLGDSTLKLVRQVALGREITGHLHHRLHGSKGHKERHYIELSCGTI